MTAGAGCRELHGRHVLASAEAEARWQNLRLPGHWQKLIVVFVSDTGGREFCIAVRPSCGDRNRLMTISAF